MYIHMYIETTDLHKLYLCCRPIWSNVLFLNQVCTWFFEIAFVRDVGMSVCVSTPEATNNIHVIFNLYNELNKFVAFRNVTRLSMHGRGHCNE